MTKGKFHKEIATKHFSCQNITYNLTHTYKNIYMNTLKHTWLQS